ncbi:FIG00930665: hypothetical protein [hydrothermal vent metagenome]|uniref:Uncharacterized protein n=1 Tax=hydrothermal vent metagenome TaxID=652676 RepID=A0A3B0VQZ5_9ZZZZ
MKKIFLFLLLINNYVLSHPYTPCDENGMADIYPCENIDLLYRVHIPAMGGISGDTGSDIWGWSDPDTNKEYAIITLSYGTTFVDITDPTNPIYLGKLPTATGLSMWRDVKTYANHAFIVSEASGHGMQVFDLTLLRNIVSPPLEFTASTRYTGFGNAHNIVINETTGFAYAVGTSTCGGGLHMVNIQNPTNPTNAGCFSSDGYTHDAQCVSYIGPDTDYTGKEICFNANEDTVTIVDVTIKSAPIQIARAGYSGSQYTHQGWLTEDHRYYLMNDELDEQNNGHNTKTYIWDMLDLDSPQLIGFYNGPQASTDHNLYIKGNYAYLSNYTSGLRIIDISDIGNANLQEVASFDSYPANNDATLNGTWSNYPYFASGTVIMSDFDGGLYILGPNICPQADATKGLMLQANGDNRIDLSWQNDLAIGETYNVYRSDGGCAVDNFEKIASNISTATFSDNLASGGVSIGYKVSKVDIDAKCESERSTCVETITTGNCTVAPQFAGITSVNSSNTASCGIDVTWSPASGYCSNDISYDVFKSTDPAFVPDSSNKVAAAIGTNQWHDVVVSNDTEYYYLVRATDESNQSQDSNLVKLSDIAQGKLTNGIWSVGAEIGDVGIDQASRHVGWELNTTRVYAGNRSYWSQSQSDICNNLVTQSISLTVGESSQLSFWTLFAIENEWDGGVVEISTDATQWDQGLLTPSYPGTFRESHDSCGYTQGTPSFTGTNLSWQQHTMDLSTYQGQDIKIRWNYSTDNVINEEGWYLDDINVTNTQISSQCSGLTDNIYSSGFELN